MDYEEIADLEVLELRKKLKEIETRVLRYEALLQEHGLLDKLTQESDAEVVCSTQISKLKELSDKGIPFSIEEIKCLEILVKTLMVARGKVVAEEKTTRKKKAGPEEVANLLKIVGDKQIED